MSKSLAVLTLVAIAAVANSQDSDVGAKAMKCATDFMTTKKCGEGCEMTTAQGQQVCSINMQDGIRQAAAAAAAEVGGADGALAEQMLNNMASNPAMVALVKKCVALTDCNADADCQSAEGGGGCSPTEKATLKFATSGTAASGGAAATSINVAAGEAAPAPAAGDKCKGFGALADMSLAAPDGELVEAEMAKKAGTDKDFLAAMLAMNAQVAKCEGDAACPAASQCVKAGTDCEPDFLPFLKVTKCGAGVNAKVAKAFNRAKAADVKKAKAKVATAKVAVTAAKAKKEKADKEVAACGDTCAPEVKVAASTAASEYEAAQRTEAEAATKASNADASASNAADAATKADAESGAAPVAVGAAAVAGVVFAQLF